ncbi:MAG: hypothetical protein KKF56_03960 [Nanoarchaeota archaeon]|nr:hypothetical protein [Nanoarchaeota archaeon]
MKKKASLFLSEQTLRILIGIAGVLILLSMGGYLYGVYSDNQEELQVEALLKSIKDRVEVLQASEPGTETLMLIENPKGWYILSINILGKFCICSTLDERECELKGGVCDISDLMKNVVVRGYEYMDYGSSSPARSGWEERYYFKIDETPLTIKLMKGGRSLGIDIEGVVIIPEKQRDIYEDAKDGTITIPRR